MLQVPHGQQTSHRPLGRMALLRPRGLEIVRSGSLRTSRQRDDAVHGLHPRGFGMHSLLSRIADDSKVPDVERDDLPRKSPVQRVRPHRGLCVEERNPTSHRGRGQGHVQADFRVANISRRKQGRRHRDVHLHGVQDQQRPALLEGDRRHVSRPNVVHDSSLQDVSRGHPRDH